jgi:hypothetical protein
LECDEHFFSLQQKAALSLFLSFFLPYSEQATHNNRVIAALASPPYNHGKFKKLQTTQEFKNNLENVS